jgi:hypothetical protein
MSTVKTHEVFLRDEGGFTCREGPIRTCVFVSESLRDQVLGYMHGSSLSELYRIAKTGRRIGSQFWWPKFRKDKEGKVKSCLVCELARASPPPLQGKKVEFQPTRRFELVVIYVTEVSPKSEQSISKIVAIGDTFTRFAWAYPLADENFETVSTVLLDGWMLQYVPPEKLLSDRGKVFTGQLLEMICTKLTEIYV